MLRLENIPRQYTCYRDNCSHKEVELPRRQLSRGRIYSTGTYKLHEVFSAALYLEDG